MKQDAQESGWLNRVDAFLEKHSWDHTWARMMQLVKSVSILIVPLKRGQNG